ncbi:helix-turn-helix domain-containing protein [Nocardia xishanensis]|uniref:helix-turn-helix domain-containing protein n=1 Tax=Nocardia xishanensis TaxID=238964 RepID=UPI00147217D1|nr:helix-turn-helix transcriptional regulator [Nocardia xishanensis]
MDLLNLVSGLLGWRRAQAAGRALSAQLAANRNAFKADLVRAREDAGLSREDVAERLGVSVEHIARFEDPKANPRLQMICSYAHAIGAIVAFDVRPFEGDKVAKQAG